MRTRRVRVRVRTEVEIPFSLASIGNLSSKEIAQTMLSQVRVAMSGAAENLFISQREAERLANLDLSDPKNLWQHNPKPTFPK